MPRRKKDRGLQCEIKTYGPGYAEKFAAETRAEAFTCNFFEAAFTWAKSAGIKLVPPS